MSTGAFILRPTEDCPLCSSPRLKPYPENTIRYWQCEVCELHFLDPKLRLSATEEEKRYLTHNNDVTDINYQNFLRPLFSCMRERVQPPAEGLDFGAGPGPALARLFEADNFPPVALYDPFFWPDQAPLEKTYDFIVTSEVVEHLHHPKQEFDRLYALLKPGAWLGIMTAMLTEQIDFANWYYRRDPTHVVFYTAQTFRYICARYDFKALSFYGDRTILLRK